MREDLCIYRGTWELLHRQGKKTHSLLLRPWAFSKPLTRLLLWQWWQLYGTMLSPAKIETQMKHSHSHARSTVIGTWFPTLMASSTCSTSFCGLELSWPTWAFGQGWTTRASPGPMAVGGKREGYPLQYLSEFKPNGLGIVSWAIVHLQAGTAKFVQRAQGSHGPHLPQWNLAVRLLGRGKESTVRMKKIAAEQLEQPFRLQPVVTIWGFPPALTHLIIP